MARTKGNSGLRRGLSLVLGLVVAMALACATPALAEEYTYTVTLYPGNRGTLSTSIVSGAGQVSMQNGAVVVSGLHLGDVVSFNVDESTVTADNPYYARGVRMGGIDNDDPDSTKQIAPSFVVDGDRDFVMAYGILGDMVRYTVEFVDESGNALAESRTYYGNVGDSPVVAHLYIDGYQPEAYNVTKTLVSDESQNVLRLVYHPVTALTTTVTTTGTTGTAAAGDADGTTGTGADGDAVADGATATADGTATSDDAGTTDEASSEPAELLSLDDDEVPQAQTPLAQTGGNDDRGVAIGMAVTAVVVIAAVIGFFIWFFVRQKRRGDSQQAEG